MRFSLCNCGVERLVRLDRSFWMRLWPGRRHYYCVACQSHELLSRRSLQKAFPALRSDLHSSETRHGTLD
jgi:hypothetical protein